MVESGGGGWPGGAVESGALRACRGLRGPAQGSAVHRVSSLVCAARIQGASVDAEVASEGRNHSNILENVQNLKAITRRQAS